MKNSSILIIIVIIILAVILFSDGNCVGSNERYETQLAASVNYSSPLLHSACYSSCIYHDCPCVMNNLSCGKGLKIEEINDGKSLLISKDTSSPSCPDNGDATGAWTFQSSGPGASLVKLSDYGTTDTSGNKWVLKTLYAGEGIYLYDSPTNIEISTTPPGVGDNYNPWINSVHGLDGFYTTGVSGGVSVYDTTTNSSGSIMFKSISAGEGLKIEHHSGTRKTWDMYGGTYQDVPQGWYVISLT